MFRVRSQNIVDFRLIPKGAERTESVFSIVACAKYYIASSQPQMKNKKVANENKVYALKIDRHSANGCNFVHDHV